VNHPETNGMIEYFVRPMGGIRTAVRFEELKAYRAQRGMGFRSRPPAVVDGPISAGTLDLPQACARAKRLASRPFKFTLTGPHMLAKTLVDHHYKNIQELALALADALAEQVRELDADVVQVDEANLPGSPDEWTFAAEAINRVLRAVKTVPAVHLCFGNYGGQSIQSGTWGKLIDYLNALEVDHIVMETARMSSKCFAALVRRSASASASSTSNQPRSSAPTISRVQSSVPRKHSGPAASPTCIPTAGSGCSSATSPTASCACWWRGATAT